MSAPDTDPGDDFGPEPPGPDLEAAEYVLGVQDAAERRRAQARIASDPGFAQRVAEWEARLAGFLSGYASVEAPAHAWAGIRRRLGWPAVEGARGTAWQSLGFWRAAAAAAITVATALAVLYTVREPSGVTPEAPVARAVTTLAHDDGTPAYLATVDTARGAIQLVPVPTGPDPEGRVPELWLIPPGEAARSLGVVTTDKAHNIPVPADLRRALAVGSVLAITLEPPGGAPKGIATGPITAKGNISSL
jgi:anti-sigma-K factor RskA